MADYEVVIGLEIHAQISTKTKMFCRCDNDAWGRDPNVTVCPICMGFPGMLPVINREAVKKGIKAALALNCTISNFSKFDRKNYFYPDLPKGFQISQYDQPLAKNGFIEIIINEEKKKIRINRLHLEDDAGKLTHVKEGTLCDYNRSGTPLMEIVSEPDLSSPLEASAYAKELQKILRYTDSSDCDMEKGMMRFDINISLRKKGQKELGVKAEVKNLNSFRALEKALIFEIKRQTEILESGEKIIQETRGFDDKTEETVPQRTKEEAHDYRYFPEPDLPPLTFSEKEIKELQKEIPELPQKKFERFLSEYKILEDDARILTEDLERAQFFEKAVSVCNDAKKATTFINTVLFKHLNTDLMPLGKCKITPEALGELINIINKGDISISVAKGEVFEEMYNSGKDPSRIIEAKGLKQVSDEEEIESICKKTIEENPKAISDIKNGKGQVMGFLVGQVMKLSKGQANPGKVNEILRKLLHAEHAEHAE